MSGYVWYSFGSDKTGLTLAESLGFDSGKKTPSFLNYDVVVGWGCKPGSKYDSESLAQIIAQNQCRILNHPEAVQMNRDKLGTLIRLRELGIATPGFLEFNPESPKVAVDTLIPHALEQGVIAFPLVMLSRHGRGEPLFCYTLEDIQVALKGNAKQEHPHCYVRTYDHGDEYRIHVFRNTALFAQKKILSDDPVATTTETLLKRLRKRREKRGLRMSQSDEDTAREMGLMLAGEILANAAQLKKSVQMGWEFRDWDMGLIPPEVAGLAIEALDAARLDMGAVSVSYVDGVPRILSMTTAPQLTVDHMAIYIGEIKAFAKIGGKTKNLQEKKEVKKEKVASPELVARLYKKLRGASAEKAEEVLKSLGE